MPAVTNPGGGMLFWGLLSAAPCPPKLLSFGCSAWGSLCAPIALDKATSASYLGQLYLGKKLSILQTSAWRWFRGHTGDWDNPGSHSCYKLSLWIQPSSFRSVCPTCPVWRRENSRATHTIFFCPAISRLETLGTGSTFLSFGQRLALGQEQGAPSRGGLSLSLEHK